MWDKLMKIREIYKDLGENNHSIYPVHTLGSDLEFHVADDKTFINLVLENNGKYKITKEGSFKYPYRISTIKDGLEVFAVSNVFALRVIEREIEEG